MNFLSSFRAATSSKAGIDAAVFILPPRGHYSGDPRLWADWSEAVEQRTALGRPLGATAGVA